MRFLLVGVQTAVLVVGATGFPSFAHADDGEAPVSLSANVSLVSDYRFRGISLSDEDIAIQGGLDIASDVGFYAGVWGSSIEQFNGAETEIDLYAGYGRDLAGITADVSIIAYTYPGGTDTNYFEVAGSLGKSVKGWGVKVGVNYAPSQSNIGNVDNIYVFGDVAVGIKDTPLTLSGHAGFEDGAFGANKIDWLLGATYSLDRFSFKLEFIGADQSGGGLDNTVVLSVGATF
ncbi:MAG: TorF family putative porin [Sphingomonadales bacterium]